MGHTRLGTLPQTRPWKQVVGLVGAGAAVAQVATATLHAAGAAFAQAANDPVAQEAFWLLTRVPLAACTDDFAAALAGCEVAVPNQPTAADVAAGVSDALDARTPRNKGRTDFGEMAQHAAIEALSAAAGAALGGRLFGVAPDDVRAAFAGLATPARFGAIAHDFFARFAAKCLHYFLSRTLGEQVGPGQRFRTVADQTRFEDAVRTHCREAARIVERFAADWQSKVVWESGGDISRKAAAGFAAHAFDKLDAELRRGGPA